MTRFAAAVAALGIVAIALALAAPATLVAPLVARHTHGALVLAEAEGSAWRGRGTLATADGRLAWPLAWRVAPAALLRGALEVALLPVAGGPSGFVTLHSNQAALRDAAVDVPLAGLGLPGDAVAGGEVRLSTPRALRAADRSEGTVRIDWTRARLALPGLPPLDLGNVTATLAADGRRWRGPVQARGGTVEADGDLSVDDAGADLALLLRLAPGAPEALRRLGPADASGAVALRLAPRFR